MYDNRLADQFVKSLRNFRLVNAHKLNSAIRNFTRVDPASEPITTFGAPCTISPELFSILRAFGESIFRELFDVLASERLRKMRRGGISLQYTKNEKNGKY